jgi:hypothetical protein
VAFKSGIESSANGLEIAADGLKPKLVRSHAHLTLIRFEGEADDCQDDATHHKMIIFANALCYDVIT